MKVGVPKETGSWTSAAWRWSRMSCASCFGGARGRRRGRRRRARADPRHALRRGRRDDRRSVVGRDARRQGRSAERRRGRAASHAAQCYVGFLAPRDGAARPPSALAAAGVDGVRDGGDPADLARAGDGRAVARRPTSRGYKAALLGAEHSTRFLPDADDRRGHDPAGARCSSSASASPACRRWPPRGGSARRRPATTSAPRSPSRSQSLGAKWLDLGIEAAGEGGYARELTEEEQAAAAAGADRRDQDASTSSSRPRSCPDARRRGSSPPRPSRG